MAALAGPLLNILLSLVIGALIRLYPLRAKLRVSIPVLALVYGLVFAAQAAVFVVLRERFAADYLGNQIYKVLSGSVIMFLPFALTRKSVFQNLFLIGVVAQYTLVVFGAGSYAELAWGGEFARRWPYITCDAVVLVLSIPILPFTLWALKKLFAIWPEEKVLVWKLVWVIPILFTALGMATSNVFMGEASVATLMFPLARVISGGGMIATCLLLAGALRREADRAALRTNQQMMERQLSLQREQYAFMAETNEAIKVMHHDMRHQFAVVSGYLEGGDVAGALTFCKKAAGGIPSPAEKTVCQNFAVNAVAVHYLALARADGTDISVQLDIPANTGSVPEPDLCVVIGNLLENAVEACRRVPADKRFLRLKSRVRHGTLYITLDNSFDGALHCESGIYFSGKREGAGLGLTSIQAVCEKYGGLAQFRANGDTFQSSAMLTLSPSSTEPF